MKPGKITHTFAALLSSVSSLFAHGAVTKAEPTKVKLSKKSEKKSDESRVGVDSLTFAPTRLRSAPPSPGEPYPWRCQIVTTVFWIGEKPSENNPARRQDYTPVKFTPRQNPFYCALPYNDKAATGHRPEAAHVIPWFKDAYQGPAVSVCKDRWIAIRKGNKVVYAQWEDAGPFRTDHWQYVFGNERPKPNLNKGAGLDVSPAVRDYLGLNETDVTDWQFVDFKDVPRGPWSKLGENNTFVINDRNEQRAVARAKAGGGAPGDSATE